MRRPRLAIVLLLAAIFGAMAPSSGRADAIDGNWCAADGRVMTIEGPAITTPGGGQIAGDYRRHAFAYVVPADERGAGAEVTMILLDEDTLQLSPGPGAGTEIWQRCDVIS